MSAISRIFYFSDGDRNHCLLEIPFNNSKIGVFAGVEKNLKTKILYFQKKGGEYVFA
jgi:hypothetical protein